MANLISQAFVINIYINKLNTYQANHNVTGLYYMYGIIVRNVFFYPVPEAESFLSESSDQTVNPEILKRFAKQLEYTMKKSQPFDILDEEETVACEHNEEKQEKKLMLQ